MEEKFKQILRLQDKGLTRHEIKDKLGYKRLDSMTKYMSNKGYKVYNEKYILRYDKDMTNVTDKANMAKDEKLTVNDDKDMTIDIFQDLKRNIINLANDYDKIQEVLMWFNSNDDKGMTEVIEVINEGIKINLSTTENIRTTIRINKDTWNRFDKFARDNKEFNKQDLMAQALEDYMNKFQK